MCAVNPVTRSASLGVLASGACLVLLQIAMLVSHVFHSQGKGCHSGSSSEEVLPREMQIERCRLPANKGVQIADRSLQGSCNTSLHFVMKERGIC